MTDRETHRQTDRETDRQRQRENRILNQSVIHYINQRIYNLLKAVIVMLERSEVGGRWRDRQTNR